MSNGVKIITEQQTWKRKWARPILTVIILIATLIFLTDGEILESFVYTNF